MNINMIAIDQLVIMIDLGGVCVSVHNLSPYDYFLFMFMGGT